MAWFEVVTVCLNVLCCIPMLASLTTFDSWLIRGFDFPRVQISVVIILIFLLTLFIYNYDVIWQYILSFLLVVSIIYEYKQIFPYTVLARKQVMRTERVADDPSISILVSNVLTPNRGYKRFKELVQSYNPDVFLSLETDQGWEDALQPLEDTYSYSVKVPLDNLYGMHLYSKFPLENMEIKYLVEPDIPSIHGTLRLAKGVKVAIHCLHPRPPSPSENDSSTERDAELLLVARSIDVKKGPVLVFGDFNDVAWSRTTRLFQKISGLLDPRRGRGFFNTYHTQYPLLRWPLDHVFLSQHFSLITLDRGPNIGSDHFPMYAKLSFTPQTKDKHETPEADKDEKQWADEKIDEGKPSERSV